MSRVRSLALPLNLNKVQSTKSVTVIAFFSLFDTVKESGHFSSIYLRARSEGETNRNTSAIDERERRVYSLRALLFAKRRKEKEKREERKNEQTDVRFLCARIAYQVCVRTVFRLMVVVTRSLRERDRLRLVHRSFKVFVLGNHDVRFFRDDLNIFGNKSKLSAAVLKKQNNFVPLIIKTIFNQQIMCGFPLFNNSGQKKRPEQRHARRMCVKKSNILYWDCNTKHVCEKK